MTRHSVEPLDNPHVGDARQAAQGILSLATAAMATAIRKISIERGRDPRKYALFAYGGGGPLHAPEIARELHIGKVVIPPNAGVFSALSMLYADIARERSRTAHMHLIFRCAPCGCLRNWTRSCAPSSRIWPATRRSPAIAASKRTIAGNSIRKVEGAMTAEAVRAAFERAYVARYRHSQPRREVEVVNFRLTLRRRVPHPNLDAVGAAQTAPGTGGVEYRTIHIGSQGDAPAAVYQRSNLSHGSGGRGACTIEEHGSTTLVGPGERFEVGTLGEITITLRDERSPP